MSLTKKLAVIFFSCVILCSAMLTTAFAGQSSNSYLYKYCDSLIITIDSPIAFLEGNAVLIDSDSPDLCAFTQDDRTMVPVRFISEALGMTVSWNGEEQTVTVKAPRKNTAVFTIGQTSIQRIINDGTPLPEYHADTSPVIINNRTFLPLRALIDATEYMKIDYIDGVVFCYYGNELVIPQDLKKAFAQNIKKTASSGMSVDAVNSMRKVNLFGFEQIGRAHV